MEEQLLASIIGDIGIPAIICFYTLFGVNKTLQKQDVTLKELADAINKLTIDVKKIERLDSQTRELTYKVEKLQTDFELKFVHSRRGDSNDLQRHT